ILDLPFEIVHHDYQSLYQALHNLLENALKFSRPQFRPRIEIGGEEREDRHILWVRDNGIGFDMQYHERIFDIFQRLNHSEDYPGTGVGLAIVRKAMERVGGRAWAVSAPGQGATFYLEIPRQAGL
ncbi:MAG: sensor histidine kinase, partial [Bellilinea sp.]